MQRIDAPHFLLVSVAHQSVIELCKVSQHCLQLLVLFVPGSEDTEAGLNRLLEVVERDGHETLRGQHFEHLVGEVLGDGLDELNSAREWILSDLGLLQVTEYSHDGQRDLVEFGGRDEFVEREVLHEYIVVLSGLECLLETCIRIEAHRGEEPLAVPICQRF